MRLPDGPQTPPFLQLIQWIARPLEFLDTNARHYGDCFTMRLGGFPPIVCLSNPQAIQGIFTANSNQFDSGQGNGLLRPLLGDYSLILLDGEPHQRQRRLLMPPFHGDRMRAYGQLICNLTQQVTSQWRAGELPIRSSMQDISLQVILKAVFGLREGPRYEQLRQLLGSLLESITSPLSSSLLFYNWLQRDLGSWSPWGRFLRQKQQIDQLLYAEIQQHREQSDLTRTDILTLLMAARDEAGQPMTDVELHNELLTLLLAGHETTASALTWAMYWIHSLPEVHQKLLQELDGLDPNADPGTIARLPYLSAVCQETLRIYPVALITSLRIAKSPLRVMNHSFDAGTVLAPCIYLAHHREDLYPDPTRFRPERFLERQFSSYEYLPFGGSNRRCIGAAFALFEMKLVLATILSRFELGLTDQRPVRPVRRGVTLAPPRRFRMMLTGQRASQLKNIPAQV